MCGDIQSKSYSDFIIVQSMNHRDDAPRSIRYVIPTIGMFKVTYTHEYHPYNKTQIEYSVLNIGGDFDKCVNITIHPEGSERQTELILSWTEVLDKSCTTDRHIIKGDATTEMLQLGFTLAREIAPYAKYVTLEDMSYIYCDTPDGRKKMSLPPYYIAFHDKTWYDDKFNAVMKNETNYKSYKDAIGNMYKAEFKSKVFNFGNSTIKELLYPLYDASSNWKEFFLSIKKKFGKKTCVMMYPWLNSAMNNIFKGNQIFVGQEWIISLNELPIIPYYEIDKSKVAGGGKFKMQYEIQHYNYRDVNYNDTMNWKMDTFLKGSNHKTKKGYKRNHTTRKSSSCI